MSKTAKAPRTSKQTIPTPAEGVSITPPPANPPDSAPPVGPDLQEALNATAHVRPDPQAGKTGDPQTIEVIDLCARLSDTIRRQTGDLLGFIIERGAIVADIIDTSLRKARNDATRKNQRAGAIRTAELTALGAYDADIESKPDPDRWHRLYRLAQLFPETRDLPSVSVATVFSALLTRDDPPATWDAPETWSLKPQFDADRVRATLATAATERYTRDDADAAMDALKGAEPETPKAKKKPDNVATAKQTAKRIMDQIADGKIHPETLFDELTALLTRYGWRLTIGKDAHGQTTIKPVKVQRDVIQLAEAANG
jgi:hypothetical protein